MRTVQSPSGLCFTGFQTCYAEMQSWLLVWFTLLNILTVSIKVGGLSERRRTCRGRAGTQLIGRRFLLDKKIDPWSSNKYRPTCTNRCSGVAVYLIEQIDSDIIEKGHVPPVVAVLFVDGFLRRLQQTPQSYSLVNVGLCDDDDLPRGLVLLLFLFLVLFGIASCWETPSPANSAFPSIPESFGTRRERKRERQWGEREGEAGQFSWKRGWWCDNRRREDMWV